MSDPNTIKIDVKSRYLSDQSRPLNNKFVFSYTITINNLGDESVQLISRRWLITDAQNRIQEVSGIGVVGETPTIPAGGKYTYTSGSMIDTATGTMEGSYQMRDHTGEMFDVPIPLFGLIPPQSLH